MPALPNRSYSISLTIPFHEAAAYRQDITVGCRLGHSIPPYISVVRIGICSCELSLIADICGRIAVGDSFLNEYQLFDELAMFIENYSLPMEGKLVSLS